MGGKEVFGSVFICNLRFDISRWSEDTWVETLIGLFVHGRWGDTPANPVFLTECGFARSFRMFQWLLHVRLNWRKFFNIYSKVDLRRIFRGWLFRDMSKTLIRRRLKEPPCWFLKNKKKWTATRPAGFAAGKKLLTAVADARFPSIM